MEPPREWAIRAGVSISPAQVADAALRWALDLPAGAATQLAAYGTLLLHWSARLSLTAIRDPEELIDRHLMEGAFAALHHPSVSGSRPAVLDFGSGTGVPGVPIAICRPDLCITLAESQRKKAVFLQEVARHLQLDLRVHAGRAEALPAASFVAVWMRAVDRRSVSLPAAEALVQADGHLCLLGGATQPGLPAWHWLSVPLPHSERRVLHIGSR